ncbi:hypothetical protein [Peterkaempfera griseoplana]|uniref:hypothetical protein n=1 Tax=Peterkaempfera griseoplana TaxID=66896 RepID=UPI0006E304A6|nr:hypothetical protein [Peterkaempfera griseoplana]
MTDQQISAADTAALEPGTQSPAADPGAPAAGPGGQPPRKRRPRLRTVLRWGAAVLVLGLAGAGTAFAVTAPDRTDIPGLRTPSDGRYAFPELTLPPLPSGKPSPFADGNDGLHWAELRGLLLPAPKEATAVTTSARSSSADEQCKAFTLLFTDSARTARQMKEGLCRRGAGRTWTASDGTRTEIRLVGFGSQAEAQAFYSAIYGTEVKGVSDSFAADTTAFQLPVGQESVALTESRQVGGRQREVAHVVELRAGDLVGAVVMSNPAGVPATAYRQVVIDQAELLG